MLGPQIWNKTFRGTISEVIATEKWLDQIGLEQKLSLEVAFALQTCAEELVTNILKHSGRSFPEIDLTLKLWPDRVELLIEDDGRPFDVAAARPHAIDAPLAVVEPGGLGIQLIRSFADELSYERAGRGNRVQATILLHKSAEL
jgi:anti-sigma regulatory factor (Ser/Thr protein kinase)